MAVVTNLWVGLVALVCAACGTTSRDRALESGPGSGSGSSGNVSGDGGKNTGGDANACGDPSTAGNHDVGGSSSSAGVFMGGNGGSSGGGAPTAGAGAGSSEGPGTITDLWRDLCVATFTEDYLVSDAFGAEVFTARAGEEYLLIRYPEPYSSAELAYLTSTGPYAFDVAPNADNTAFPFTTDCPTDLEAGSYFAVFADVSVYAEPGLVTKICDLEAGAALPRDMGTGAGFALESGSQDSSVYEVFLNAFSAQCGGAMNGYISVPHTQLFGTSHVLVPFKVITGPQ